MKSTLLSLGLLLILIISCTRMKSRSLSGDMHGDIHKDSQSDVYWNSLALEATRSNNSIIDVLADNDPGLLDQIVTDAKDPMLLMFWGESLNFDSNVKKMIVDEKIIADLQGAFGIKNNNLQVHAGIIHTYGYLFSTLKTPYGYKRERWIAPTLNIAFDFTGQALSPKTIEGGLLSNVTFFAGKLAFRSQQNLTQLAALKNVANEVFTFDFQKLKKIRLEEEVENYVIVTTFIKFPKKSLDEKNDYMLVYSTLNKLNGEEKLITVFPVTGETLAKTTAPSELGQNKTISLRYNAYVKNLATKLTGQRRLLKQ